LCRVEFVQTIQDSVIEFIQIDVPKLTALHALPRDTLNVAKALWSTPRRFFFGFDAFQRFLAEHKLNGTESTRDAMTLGTE